MEKGLKSAGFLCWEWVTCPRCDFCQVEITSFPGIYLDNNISSLAFSAGLDFLFPAILAGSGEGAQKRPSGELTAAGLGQRVRHPNVHVPQSISAAISPVMEDHPSNRYLSAKVQCQPWCLFALGMTYVLLTIEVFAIYTVNTLADLESFVEFG